MEYNDKGVNDNMDIGNLLSSLLSSNDVSEKSGASKADVTSVLTEALPMLLGGTKEKKAAKSVSKSTGINLETVLAIFAAAVPVLKSLLGSSDGKSDNGGLLGGLLGGNSGIGGLLGGLLGGGNSDDDDDEDDDSSSSGLGSLLGGLLGGKR